MTDFATVTVDTSKLTPPAPHPVGGKRWRARCLARGWKRSWIRGTAKVVQQYRRDYGYNATAIEALGLVQP